MISPTPAILALISAPSENAEEVFGIALLLYESIGDKYSLARGLYYSSNS
jgi:hypothetical protein